MTKAMTPLLVETELLSAKRMRTSRNGNPRWEFSTAHGIFRTGVDAMCAYKGEPAKGPFTVMIVGKTNRVIDYGWPAYPLGR